MGEKLTWVEIREAKLRLVAVAKDNGLSPDEVRKKINDAIFLARQHPDPRVKARWATSPFDGRIPSPEEFIAWGIRTCGRNSG